MSSMSTVRESRFKATSSILLLLAAFLSVILLSISTALHFLHNGSLPEFCVATLAIIPISALIRFSTKDLVLRFQLSEREFLTALTNAIFGNCTELVFATIALVRQETLVAQTALVGGVLSNSLLILGTCFLFGGLQNHVQTYPVIVARTNSQLLVVSLASVVVPTAFQKWSETGDAGLQTLSRGAAIVLLLVFACHLLFFYYTHSNFHNFPHSLAAGITVPISVGLLYAQPNYKNVDSLRDLRNTSLRNKLPKLPLLANALILTISITMVSFISIYVLESIEAPNKAIKLSKSFIGLVVIPVVTGSAEHVAATLRAFKKSGKEDKDINEKSTAKVGATLRAPTNRDEEEDIDNGKTISWIIDVAIISSIRIALFILPLMVIIGWILGIPDMTLLFDGFQLTMLFCAILLVNHIMQTGSAHWLEGVMLVSSFILFANAAWHYPNEA